MRRCSEWAATSTLVGQPLVQPNLPISDGFNRFQFMNINKSMMYISVSCMCREPVH